MEEEEEEDEDGMATAGVPLLPGIAHSGQLQSYYDVLLPHLQMATANPFLTGLPGHHQDTANVAAQQQRLLSQHWLELLHNSVQGRLFGKHSVAIRVGFWLIH